jgi:uncharacterized membrane protein
MSHRARRHVSFRQSNSRDREATCHQLVAAGGKVVLGETPEIYGAHHLLRDRASNPEAAARIDELIAWWQEYAVGNGATLDNNPSRGNQVGGITTIWEKSLGAVLKSGTSPLNDVVGYGEPVTAPGLTFMDTPGYDPVSATGMVAGGVNLLAFTTGRGSLFGSRPVPCLKISTTSGLYERMSGDIDFDAGPAMSHPDQVTYGSALFALRRRRVHAARPPHDTRHLLHGLATLWPSYLAYVLTFMLIGQVWANHHIMFDHIRSADRVVLFLNTLLLMDVALLPFAASVLAEAFRDGHGQRTAVVFHGAAFALLAILFNVIWGYVRRDRRLLTATIDAAGVTAISRRFRLALVWLATGILLGALVPVLGVAVIAAFILYYWLPITGETAAAKRRRQRGHRT